MSPQTLVLGAATLLISLTTMLIAYASLEFSLGLILMAPVCALLCAIPLAAGVDDSRTSLAFASLIALGSAFPIGLATTTYTDFAGAALQVTVLCFSVALLAIEWPRLLTRIGLHPSLSGAFLLVIAGTWMSLPVWMSPHFADPWGEWVVDHLLAYQPLIALNGAFASLGDWSHQPLAYTWLTSLGQDVPFAFPRSAWGCAIAHFSIAAIPFIANALLQIRQKAPSPTR